MLRRLLVGGVSSTNSAFTFAWQGTTIVAYRISRSEEVVWSLKATIVP